MGNGKRQKTIWVINAWVIWVAWDLKNLSDLSLVPRDGLEPSHLLGGRFWVSCVYQFHHRGMCVVILHFSMNHKQDRYYASSTFRSEEVSS